MVGGDLYTAYTFVAVPALLYGTGAIGFYAIPYMAIEYPLVFLILIRLWSVCKTHGYVTPRITCGPGSARPRWRWPWPSPGSWPRCPTSPST